MKNLLISGINGTVGQLVLENCENYGFNVVCGVDKNIFNEKFKCPVYRDFSEVKERVDIIIDFSSATLLEQAISYACDNDCKLLSGTTGLNSTHFKLLNDLANKTSVFYDANYSFAIYQLRQVAKTLKEKLGDFDIQITEEHNINKKDAPSGTAKVLMQDLKTNNVHSLRGGNVAGRHKIIFYGENEQVEIEHFAYNKSIFAVGSLKCATFLLTKQKGLYSMSDMQF